MQGRGGCLLPFFIHHHNFNPDPNTPDLSLSRWAQASAFPLYNSASTDRK